MRLIVLKYLEMKIIKNTLNLNDINVELLYLYVLELI